MNIAAITARIGSKSIYQKNIRDFCGKPLCYWVLRELEKSNISVIYFLTDSFKIAHLVREFGFDKVKIELVQEMNDISMTDDIIYQFFKEKQFVSSTNDNLLIAQVTSPLTKFKDYNKVMQMLENKEYDTVISVTENMRHYWNKETGEPINHPKDKRIRRQEYKYSVMENGSIYGTLLSLFMQSRYRINGKIGFHMMPDYSSCEIDNEVDWKFCEYLYRTYLIKPLYPKSIKLFACDLDGVFTDGGIYVDVHGKEIKKFNVKDGHGFYLLKNKGIKTAIITSGKSDIHNHRFLKKSIKVDYLIENCHNKYQALKEICSNENLSMNEVSYIGDDILDKECLENVILPACPQDANDQIKELPGIYILEGRGGNCIRELIDHILS